jgi:hypothetical protein
MVTKVAEPSLRAAWITRAVPTPSMSPLNVSMSWISTSAGPSVGSSKRVGTYLVTSVRSAGVLPALFSSSSLLRSSLQRSCTRPRGQSSAAA